MEDLIPLIIGVLWLLYTFYSRGQKKKSRKEPASAERTEGKPTFLEQLLSGEGFQFEADERDQPLEDSPYEPFEEPEPTPFYNEKKEQKTPFLRTELSNFREEGQSQFDDDYMEDENEEDSEIFSPLVLELEMHDFDLKKAVVYSAILEAPYIDYK
jgi:hypothetical protein